MVKHIKSSTDFDGIIKPVRDKSKKGKRPPLKEVKDIAIDFETQKLVSFSQYQIYSQCNYKWAQQYIYKAFKNPPTIHLIFGTAIHEIFQQYLNIGYTISFAEADRLNTDEILLNKLKEEYIKSVKSNDGIHFSTPEELNEFYEDGLAIFKWFKSKRRIYFSSKETQLIGIEMPLHKEVAPGIFYKGFIDLVMYDEYSDKIIIYDIKSSTKGWNDWNKKDEKKISQVLIYKQYFSELYDWPIDKIDVQFFILKRKIEPNEFIEFPKRIQTFTPANGKNKIKQAITKFEEFVKDCFDNKGQYNIKEYPKNITKLCEYCPLYKSCFPS
jgi:hypothetical protein